MTYFVRLKYNSFWGIEGEGSKEEVKAKGKLLLADLILKDMIALEIVEQDFPEENQDTRPWLKPKLWKPRGKSKKQKTSLVKS